MSIFNQSEVGNALRIAVEGYFKAFPIGEVGAIAGEELKFYQEEVFESEGSLLGAGWKPLAESTIESRRRRGKWPGKIGQDTGRLAASLDWTIRGNTLEFGSNVEYAQFFAAERELLTEDLPEQVYDDIARKIAERLSG